MVFILNTNNIHGLDVTFFNYTKLHCIISCLFLFWCFLHLIINTISMMFTAYREFLKFYRQHVNFKRFLNLISQILLLFITTKFEKLEEKEKKNFFLYIHAESVFFFLCKSFQCLQKALNLQKTQKFLRIIVHSETVFLFFFCCKTF